MPKLRNSLKTFFTDPTYDGAIRINRGVGAQTRLVGQVFRNTIAAAINIPLLVVTVPLFSICDVVIKIAHVSRLPRILKTDFSRDELESVTLGGIDAAKNLMFAEPLFQNSQISSILITDTNNTQAGSAAHEFLKAYNDNPLDPNLKDKAVKAVKEDIRRINLLGSDDKRKAVEGFAGILSDVEKRLEMEARTPGVTLVKPFEKILAEAMYEGRRDMVLLGVNARIYSNLGEGFIAIRRVMAKAENNQRWYLIAGLLGKDTKHPGLWDLNNSFSNFLNSVDIFSRDIWADGGSRMKVAWNSLFNNIKDRVGYILYGGGTSELISANGAADHDEAPAGKHFLKAHKELIPIYNKFVKEILKAWNNDEELKFLSDDERSRIEVNQITKSGHIIASDNKIVRISAREWFGHGKERLTQANLFVTFVKFVNFHLESGTNQRVFTKPGQITGSAGDAFFALELELALAQGIGNFINHIKGFDITDSYGRIAKGQNVFAILQDIPLGNLSRDFPFKNEDFRRVILGNAIKAVYGVDDIGETVQKLERAGMFNPIKGALRESYFDYAIGTNNLPSISKRNAERVHSILDSTLQEIEQKKEKAKEVISQEGDNLSAGTIKFIKENRLEYLIEEQGGRKNAFRANIRGAANKAVNFISGTAIVVGLGAVAVFGFKKCKSDKGSEPKENQKKENIIPARPYEDKRLGNVIKFEDALPKLENTKVQSHMNTQNMVNNEKNINV